MNVLYPGSFDPMTYGHLSIIKRALKIFPRLTVLVANDPKKNYMFSMQDRCEIVLNAISHEIDHAQKLVTIRPWEDWTWKYVQQADIGVVIRGIRNGTDLYHEENLETVLTEMTNAQVLYMRPEFEHHNTSSTLARAYIQSNAFDRLEKYIPRHTIDLIISKQKEELT